MSLNYEELDFCPTPIGDLVLRRRRMEQFGDTDIYEVKLGEDFLMTSLFHEAEDQLAVLGLLALKGNNLDIVVGGLGLGYTAVAALKDKRVSSLVVIDYLEAVIGWHKNEIVPMGSVLNNNPICHLVHADFFAIAKDVSKGFDPRKPTAKHDAILLDIDHTPTKVLNPTNAHVYSEKGLTELASHLKPGGVFALWADGTSDLNFIARLKKVFNKVDGHTIEFSNPITGGTSTGAVYVAKN